MKRTYSNGEITVYWDSEKCIRAGKCDGQLPQVFNPGRRPWVDVNAADAETIKRVIDTCPTGALSYEPSPERRETTFISVIENGPLKITGPCCVMNEDGEVLETGKAFALCRCGVSRKMPFCDGSHYRQRRA